MSKGDRKREAAAQRRAEEERRRQERKKRRRRNAWILGVVAVLAAGGVLAGVLAGLHHKKVTDPDYLLHNTMAATSDNFEVTQAMMTYFINSTALNFTTQYEDQLENIGLDVNTALSSQTCYFNSSMTWLQYFAASAEESVKWMLGFAEEARATGLTLSDDDRSEIDTMLTDITPSNYGEYLTKDDIRACMELYYMAQKQETVVNNALVFTDDEIDAYYEENKLDFLTADYAYYTVTFGEEGDYEEETTAKALAEELAVCTDEEFETKVKEALVASKVYTDETVDDGYVAESVVRGYAYTVADGFSDWLFADDRAVGDATVVEGVESYTVYRVLTAPARDSSATVDVRHILLTSSVYGSDEAAAAKAEEVLAEWQTGEATAASFGELAAQYTEDSNGYVGGLYEGVTEGQMVTAFNDWCFDESRQPGDSGIVQTGYGYHVMYFVGTNEAWYATARTQLQDTRYDQYFDGYLTAYHVTIDEDAVSAIDM